MPHDIIIMIDRKYWISFANGFLIFLNMTDEIDSEKFYIVPALPLRDTSMMD